MGLGKIIGIVGGLAAIVLLVRSKSVVVQPATASPLADLGLSYSLDPQVSPVQVNFNQLENNLASHSLTTAQVLAQTTTPAAFSAFVATLTPAPANVYLKDEVRHRNVDGYYGSRCVYFQIDNTTVWQLPGGTGYIVKVLYRYSPNGVLGYMIADAAGSFVTAYSFPDGLGTFTIGDPC